MSIVQKILLVSMVFWLMSYLNPVQAEYEKPKGVQAEMNQKKMQEKNNEMKSGSQNMAAIKDICKDNKRREQLEECRKPEESKLDSKEGVEPDVNKDPIKSNEPQYFKTN